MEPPAHGYPGLAVEPELLAGCGFEDEARATRLLAKLGERCGAPHEAGPLLEALLPLLREAPDPEMALLNLERWSSQLPTPATTLSMLRDDPRLLADLLAVFGSSQYLSDILVRDPWLYGTFAEPPLPRTPEQYRSGVDSALRSLRKPEGRRDALRRVKRREFLRIGWRDLARGAPLEEIVREISDLADALIQGALDLAREELAARFPGASAAVRFTVLAMGKLGARELNYSSDVDLVFVMDSPDPLDEGHRRYGTRLAETLIRVLSEDTAEGRCFRVDMRLRPEGRYGALVRSLGAFRDYYDRWAETWERQALIKVRPVAGDEELGERFIGLVRPVVYRQLQGATLLQDVREMRAAVERKLDAAGESAAHVKEGRGTIRDVEFTVQVLQLLFGASHPALQVSDTLTALERLEAEGVLTRDEHATFASGYRFFRELEHRLQIMDDLPVRLVPAGGRALLRLARSMGFAGSEELLREYRERSHRVRALSEAIQERLGVDTGEEADPIRTALLAADTPSGGETLRGELETRGFPGATEAAGALARLAAGPVGFPHPAATRRLFADVAPALLAACAEAADPGWALEGLAEYADRKLVHRALYQTWSEHPGALGSLARFAGTAPVAMRVLLRFPELADLVTDEELLAHPRTADELGADLEARLAGAGSYERQLSVLRRFKLREWVRIAARHVLAAPTPRTETAEWSDLADVLLGAALRTAVARLRARGRWEPEDAGGFAVFALGRYGGRDLHFASDLDLLYVSGAGGLPQQQYELLARTFSEVVTTVTEEGALFEIDLRLRPEGRQGSNVASLEAARRYYGEGGRAQTWELQMLTRLRFVAGSAAVGGELRELLQPRVYRSPAPPEWRDEIRAMKRRIERERVPEAERARHLKLGAGGLSDIEFLVQYLQLVHGAAAPALRDVSTAEVLEALAELGVLEPEEVRVLSEGHRFLTRLRQSLSLLRADGPADLVPLGAGEERLGRALARAEGFPDAAALEEAYGECTREVRQVFLEHLGQSP